MDRMIRVDCCEWCPHVVDQKDNEGRGCLWCAEETIWESNGGDVRKIGVYDEIFSIPEWCPLEVLQDEVK